MNVADVKDKIESTLNSSALSWDSVYGIIIILILGIAIYRGVRRTLSSPIRVLGLIFLLEVGHILAFSTSLGTDVPVLRVIFKYDVLTAIAQLFVGTKIGDGLLWVQAWINAVVMRVWGVVGYIGHVIGENMKGRFTL